MVALIAMGIAPSVSADPLVRSHQDEIQAYASILAMALTASDRCADILVNQPMLEKAPAFFNITPDDKASSDAAITLERKRLAAAIDAAPSLKAWCDEAYRAYGPSGDVVQDLLAR